MGQGRTLYRCVAGVEPNNLPQTNPESVKWLWSNLQSSKIPPACYLRSSPERSAKSWVLMRQRRPFNRCVAAVEPNNLPQTESESGLRLWSNLPSRYVPPACYLRPPPQKTAKSWVLMRQGRRLYRCVAGVEPNNLQQTNPESVKWLWSNLQSSKVRQLSLSTKASDFMGCHGTGTYFIPLRSWRRAQQPPANRIGIGHAVVE